MDFDPPEAVRPLLERIDQFVTDAVMPAEASVMERGFGASVALLDELRARCKAAGLWGPQLPHELGGLGLGLVEHGLVSERLGRSPLGPLRVRLPGARRRQHRDPPQVRHAGAEGALARAARPRQDPVVLLDDRAREPGLEPDDDVVPRGAVRR